MELNKEILKSLRNKLGKGDLSKIASQTGFNRNYVGLVLAGKRYNENIIKSAVELAEQKKNNTNQTVKRIKKL